MNGFSKQFRSFLEDFCFSFEERRDGLSCVLVPNSVIRPFPLILFFSIDGKQVIFRNALSFTVGKKPKQISRIFVNPFKSLLKDVEINVSYRKDSMDLIVSNLPSLDVEVFYKLVKGYAWGFTDILFSFREYSLAEFNRFGISYGNYRVIFILATLNELGDSIFFESKVMTEDFITKPNDEGVYLSKGVGKDYLKFPVLSIVSEKMDRYIIYVPDMEEGDLVPIDIKEELSFIKDNLPLSFIEERRDLINVLSRLVDKPHLILDYLGTLKEIVSELKERRIKNSPDVSIRERPRNILGFISFTKFPSDEVIDESLERLEKLIENLEYAVEMEKKLRRLLVYRIILEGLGDVDSFIMGKTISERVKKLHKFGGGRALYLGQDEIKDILGDQEKVRVKIMEDAKGRKRIIIEPIDDEEK